MSRITGDEPAWWHKDGKHNMNDPRKIAGLSPNFYSADERAYVAHLIDHENRNETPEREADDPAEITSLFDLIEHHEQMNAKLRLLILALRQRNLNEPANQEEYNA